MLTHLTLKSVIDINKGRIKPIVAKNSPRPTAPVENVAVEPKPYEPPTNKNYDLNQIIHYRISIYAVYLIYIPLRRIIQTCRHYKRYPSRTHNKD